MSETIQQIRLEDLVPSPGNRRVGGFDQAKLEQLAESIRAVGVQQPIIARPVPDQPFNEIVAGERRWRACAIAGLATAPVILRELSDVQVLQVQTIENLQREDVHPLDEAEGYARLMEVAHYDVERIAAEVGKSVSYVYQRLKLRELAPETRSLLEKGEMSASHAVLIARLPPAEQERCATYLREEARNWSRYGKHEASVSQLEAFIAGEIVMDLGAAAFRKDDADLVPKAGACRDCAKRTGYQPLLFADVCRDGKDQCLDRACYQSKLDALVKRKAEELGPDIIRMHGGLSYGDPRKDKEAVQPYDVAIVDKGTKGARPVLVTTGPNRGEVLYGKLKPQRERYQSYEPSPQEKAKREQERKRWQAERERRASVYAQLVEVVAQETLRDGLAEDVLLLLALGLRDLARDNTHTEEGEAALEGLDDKAIRKLHGQELMSTVARLGVLAFLDSNYYSQTVSARELMAMAKARGIKPVAKPKEPPAEGPAKDPQGGAGSKRKAKGAAA